MTSPIDLWKDKDKRRAVLLSLFLHLSAVLFLAFLVQVPQVEPKENYVVIDVGQPAIAEVEVQAPAAGAPAPQAPTPSVADRASGVPQTPEVSGPEPTPAAPPEQAPAQATAPPPDEAAEAAQPEQAAAPEPAPREAQAPPPTVAPEVQAPLPQPSVPAPPPVQAPELPLAEAPPSTALPEIEPPEIEPQPLAQAVRIPQPQAQAQVPEARLITPSPLASVAAAREVPQPQVQTAVAAPRNVPQPQAQASVAASRALPQPDAEASVTAPVSVNASPQVRVAQARSVATTPQINVAQEQAIATTPQVRVAQARSVAAAPTASIAAPRSVQTSPQVSVASARAVPAPVATATVRTPEPQGAAAGAETTDVAAAAGNVDTDTPAGGNDVRAGQTQDQEGARAAALGAAAAPQGVDTPTGSPASPTPYTGKRERPVAVLLDNANGYPQSGLREASAILEMPVEGGLTRLMTVYDEIDPAQVGPIRSARTYFVKAAQDMNAVLVHDGGAPGAIAAIERSSIPTFNAYSFGVLFVRADSRSAPYNLYSSGEVLRQAVNRLDLGRIRDVSGRVFRPAEESSEVTGVRVAFSSVYASGFRYEDATNLYRWQRQGQPASDASGEAVLVDAVVVARIDAHTIPGDTEGRLYIPLDGGDATLYLRGRAVSGHWSSDGGFAFVTDDGKAVDLTPFKHWILFAPQYAEVTAQ